MFSDIHSIDEAVEAGAFDPVPPEREPLPSVGDINIDQPPVWLDTDDIMAGRYGVGTKRFQQETPSQARLKIPCVRDEFYNAILSTFQSHNA